MPRETSKARRSRIALDYYRRPSAGDRLRRALVLGALAAAIGWLALAPACDRAPYRAPQLFQWNRMASPGPLARAHSAWESDCERCHRPYAAIDHSHWAPALVAAGRGSDTKCQACHTEGAHSAHEVAEHVPACAACHRDHRGREAALVSSDDRQCTRCHADIVRHRQWGPGHDHPAGVNPITAFEHDGHPEFALFFDEKGKASRPRDPGRLRFNHGLHLAPGLTLEPGAAPFLVSRLAEADRSEYMEPAANGIDAIVQLKCASCHHAEADGLRFAPITYDADCRACHALDFDSNNPSLRAPHGVSPREIVEFLRTLYRADAVREDPTLLRRAIVPANRGVPGADDDFVAQAGDAIDSKVHAALRMLFSGKRGCVECHEVGIDAAISSKSIEVASIDAPAVPRTWLPRARFAHEAHRAIACGECHANVRSSTTDEDVLMPSIDTCFQCHNSRSKPSQAPSSVGNACTTCHRYHGESSGAHPQLSVEEFLGGHREAK